LNAAELQGPFTTKIVANLTPKDLIKLITQFNIPSNELSVIGDEVIVRHVMDNNTWYGKNFLTHECFVQYPGDKKRSWISYPYYEQFLAACLNQRVNSQKNIMNKK